MKRLHLFELEDQPWLPAAIRNGMVDCLRFFFGQLKPYQSTAAAIKDLMERSGQTEVLDLGSGGGGGIEEVSKELDRLCGRQVPVTLSDKFPNLDAFRYLKEKSGGQISYLAEPVDALAVPAALPGVRTLYTAFHHFTPEQALRLMQKAAADKVPIGIFEGTVRKPLNLLLMLPQPFVILLCTPLMRPFRWNRLFWTYLVPAIPAGVFWDGVASFLRLYSEKELRNFMQLAALPGYQWELRRVPLFPGISTVQLLGWPEK